MGESKQISLGRLRELLNTPHECESPYRAEAVVAGREFYQWLRRTRLSDDADWDMFFSVALPRRRYLVVVVSRGWALDEIPCEVISSDDAKRLLDEAIQAAGESSVFAMLANWESGNDPYAAHLPCSDPETPEDLEPVPVEACEDGSPSLSLERLIANGVETA